ncbi:sugar diacid recognition domain-containing protein [Bacillus carboniphilus]|uniref:Sugar diacid recognition domain-containing protein n=1 Tax=Bacillus carboniphilus TaxID=86663 RepID=A0ABP3G600_9BACI
MLLNENLAQRIVEEVKKLMNEEVIVTDIEGIIRASTNPSRIGEFHEGAVLAIRDKQAIHMTEEKVKKLKGVRFGIVLPLMIHEKPLGVIGITGKPEVVAPYGQLLKRVTELFIQENSYREEQERLTRELELFVFDWLHADQWGEDLIERSSFFQVDMYSYHQVLVIKSADDPFQLTFSDIETIQKQWRSYEGALFIRWGQEKLLVFIPIETNSIKKQDVETLLNILSPYTKGRCIAGVGQKVDPKAILKSYNQAERAVLVATKRNGVVFEEELQFDILQYSLPEEAKREFIKRTILPIQNEEVLLRTLQAWFQNNLSNKEAARELHIHINTLHYRLRKIEEITSLDLNNIHHLVMLYVAYRFMYEDTKNSH